MSKIAKVISAILALVAVFLLFAPQVAIETSEGFQYPGVTALLGGDWGLKVTHADEGAVSGFVGYMLLAGAVLVLLATTFVPFFKEHEILNIVMTVLAILLLIVGMILIFTIRYVFDTNCNPTTNDTYVGWGAIAAGSLAGVAIIAAGLGLVFDFSK